MVEIAGKAGVVEEVTLRYVRLRDGDGYVHFVPNGEIKLVSNRTRGFARAVVDVGVGYGADIEQALGGDARGRRGAARRPEQWTGRLADDSRSSASSARRLGGGAALPAQASCRRSSSET